MSKQKERKLKRLKRQRIWPYVFGIVLVIVVFSLLICLINGFLLINLIYDKMQQGYENTQMVAKVMETDWQPEKEDSLQEICNVLLKGMSGVENVCIADSNNEIVSQYGKEVPRLDYYIPVFSSSKAKYIPTKDDDDFFYLTQTGINFNLDNIDKNVIKEGGLTSENMWETGNVTTVSVWYQMPFSNEGYSVCVKSKLPIRGAEIFFFAIVLEVIIILAFVLIIYYLISIFSLVYERGKLSKILSTDVVTGGFNLQYFNKNGNRLLKKNRTNKYNYAVVTIQMDKYTNFCSCYGIREGEELLEGFVEVLQKNISKKEILAHGEKAEFALLLTYKTEEELTKRLKDMISKMKTVKSDQKKYFSIGICQALGAKNGIEAMYNCAVVARNKATEVSENPIVWFNDEMKKDQLWLHKVENDMEKALENKEFQVYLQPKYSTKEEVLSGAEALVRWIHPKEGFVAPFRFIPIFESNGFVVQLDDYMLTEVARQQAQWIEEGRKIVPISVNVSRANFVREDLAEHICQIVDRFKVPHDVIELELTESAFFDDKEVLLNTIKKLKSYGFVISMDDFGAGYSSLNSLKELPLDVVKLDAGFFRDEDEDGRGKLIVEDTISLAKKLEMRIVAEGIETREQVDFLAHMNCDLIQGYYFAKPMPVAEFEKRAFG